MASNFSQVLVSPNLGLLKEIDAKMPHESGLIEVKLKRKKSRLTGVVVLPDGVPGKFMWRGNSFNLMPGENIINVKEK